jgi:hypothetical protein
VDGRGRGFTERRIDAVWNDTRNSGALNVCQLFYAYSWDGGETWSPNVAVSPPFDSSLGYPQQNKMGDYSTVVSDATGANVAYTATFNGEQDVYYVRLFPDCNQNGISDVSDLANGIGEDCDGNHVPDECQIGPPDCLGAGSAGDGASSTPLTVTRAPGNQITLAWGASCRGGDDDYAVYEGRSETITATTPSSAAPPRDGRDDHPPPPATATTSWSRRAPTARARTARTARRRAPCRRRRLLPSARQAVRRALTARERTRIHAARA